MAKLTINMPNTLPGTPMMVPGIKGDFVNGEVYDIPDLEENTVIGVPIASIPIGDFVVAKTETLSEEGK